MVEGRTRLDRLESRLERAYRKGRLDVAEELEAELALPPFPAALSHVWNAWRRIRRRKASGQFGPEPIEWPDIDAFLRRSDVTLRGFEVGYLELIDDAFLTAQTAGPSASEEALAIKDSVKGLSAREKTARVMPTP